MVWGSLSATGSLSLTGSPNRLAHRFADPPLQYPPSSNQPLPADIHIDMNEDCQGRDIDPIGQLQANPFTVLVPGGNRDMESAILSSPTVVRLPLRLFVGAGLTNIQSKTQQPVRGGCMSVFSAAGPAIPPSPDAVPKATCLQRRSGRGSCRWSGWCAYNCTVINSSAASGSVTASTTSVVWSACSPRFAQGCRILRGHGTYIVGGLCGLVAVICHAELQLQRCQVTGPSMSAVDRAA